MSIAAFDELLRVLRRERDYSDYIPYSSLVAPSTVMGRKGELFATFRCQGVPFETADGLDLDRLSQKLNLWLRGMPPDIVVTVHRLRRPVRDRLSSPAQPAYAHDFSYRYNQVIGSVDLMSTEFYVTLTEPGSSKLAVKGLSLEERQSFLQGRLAKFENLCAAAAQALLPFVPERLSSYKENGIAFSEQLSFYNYLLTLQWQPVRVTESPLWQVLGNAEIYLQSDTVKVETATSARFAQGLEIKDYCPATVPGLLDDLLYPDPASGLTPYSFIETQTFRVMSLAEGKKFLTLQKRQLSAGEDDGFSQVAALDQALDELVDGAFCVGDYSYGLLVIGDNAQIARQNTLDAAEKLKRVGILPYASTLALGGLYFSQLPGNLSLAPRQARLMSTNFSHFAPFHNLPQGKRDGNPWGEALILLRTPAQQPYYFNLHTSPLLEHSEGKPYLGNSLVIGTSGSGKTVLLNTLLIMAQKYRTEKQKLTVLYFDKDRGAEIAIRANAGGYLTVQNGQPTGFNPFALDNNEKNVQFLISLTKLLLSQDGQPLSAVDETRLSDGIRALMTMPKEQRRLGVLPQLLIQGLSAQERENSLTQRLARWTLGGDLAWVFDNPKDELDFDKPLFGIDGTDFLDNREVRTPLSYYLLYRMESVIDGRRFVAVMDEFWKWIKDPAFSDFAYNKLKTIRKQNGLVIFATQSPADVLNNEISRACVEQLATLICYPNPKATEEDYIQGFKLTPAEFEIVRNLDEHSRCALVKQGQTSTVVSINLAGFPHDLPILSGSTENTELCEQIRSRCGEDPQIWIPALLQEIQKRKRAVSKLE